jgi:hypothetical protein
MAQSAGHPGVIALREEATELPTDARGEGGVQFVALMVWNTDSLSWERMRQPQIAPLADSLPLDTRFEYSDGAIIYKGIHGTHKAATDDTSWLIWKYGWTGSDITRIEGPLEGAWDNRAGLAWA